MVFFFFFTFGVWWLVCWITETGALLLVCLSDWSSSAAGTSALGLCVHDMSDRQRWPTCSRATLADVTSFTSVTNE